MTAPTVPSEVEDELRRFTCDISTLRAAILTALAEAEKRGAERYAKLLEAAQQEHGGVDMEPECPICHALAELKEIKP